MSENNSAIKITMISIIAIIVIAVIAIFFIRPMYIEKELPKPVVINTTGQPTIGNPNAKIHLVAFEDLKCSNCARFNVELMPYIKKDLIEKNVATYTLINLAFIEGSMPAANAAHCVYQQSAKLFFEYTDYIFHHQPPETENWATVPNLLNYANDVKGINTTQLSQCLVQSPYDQFMHHNLLQAIKIMPNGIVQTPTLYINGVIVQPLTRKQIERVIEAVK